MYKVRPLLELLSGLTQDFKYAWPLNTTKALHRGSRSHNVSAWEKSTGSSPKSHLPKISWFCIFTYKGWEVSLLCFLIRGGGGGGFQTDERVFGTESVLFAGVEEWIRKLCAVSLSLELLRKYRDEIDHTTITVRDIQIRFVILSTFLKYWLCVGSAFNRWC